MPLFVWAAAAAKDFINRQIDARMNEAGRAAVAESRRVVHVRTGKLRDSIGYTYRQSDRTLQLHADMFYAVYEEEGTRYHGPHPFLRPGLAAAGRVFGMKTEIQYTNVRPTVTHPAAHQMRRIKKNELINAKIDRRLGKNAPTRVFHGDHPGSLLKFKPSYKHTRKF